MFVGDGITQQTQAFPPQAQTIISDGFSEINISLITFEDFYFLMISQRNKFGTMVKYKQICNFKN